MTDPIWQHRGSELRLGDGLAGMAALADESVHAVLVDPPYGMMVHADVPKSGLNQHGSVRRNLEFDHHVADLDNLREMYTALLGQSARVLTTGGWVAMWLKAERLNVAEEVGTAVGLRYRHPLILHRTNPTPRIRVQGPCVAHEFAALFSKGAGIFYGKPAAKCHSVMTHAVTSGSQRWHATQKPMGLMRELVQWFSPEGGVVCDPMAGSGSTLLACVELGRTGLGWEIDPKQAQVSALALSGDWRQARTKAFEYGILVGREDNDPSLFDKEQS